MQTREILIQSLELFQARKAMHVHPITVETVDSFLMGFRVAYSSCGIELAPEARRRVERRRGWKVDATGCIPQMHIKRMEDEQIMNELIAIEIEVLQEQPTSAV